MILVKLSQSGNTVYLSGHIAKKDGKPWVGQLGKRERKLNVALWLASSMPEHNLRITGCTIVSRSYS